VTAVRPRPAPPETEAPTTRARARPVRSTVPLIGAGGAALLAVLVLALVVGGSLPTRVAPGLAQAGPLVDWSLPIVTFATRVAAVGTIGTLLFAALLVPGGGAGLGDAARRAARAASAWALAWAVAVLLGGLLTLARLVGRPPTALTADSVGAFLGLPAGSAVVFGAVLALALAVLARRCRTSSDAAALLAVAAGSAVGPVLATGHSAAEADHVLAISTLAVHVLAASVWVGGLLALVVHARGRDVVAPAAARFSVLALGCFVLVGGSGLLAAWIVLGRSADGLVAAVGSGYGWLLIAKTGAFAALGWFGWRHRRRTLPALREDRPGAFRRFAGAEVAVLLATIALAVALAASPPPATASTDPATPSATAATGPAAADPMAGHDHGELSVGVLVDGTRFHVPGPVDAGSTVTVFNSSDTDASITADDGSFDVGVPGHALVTFTAPDEPGSYAFGSRTDRAYRDVLVVE
jgi:putative copper export protein